MPKKMPNVASAFAKHMGHFTTDGQNVKPGDKVKAVVHGKVSSIHQHQGDKKPQASVDINKVEHHSPPLHKVGRALGEFKRGELHSGSKHGPKVTSKAQALAIGFSEARKAGEKVPAKKGK